MGQQHTASPVQLHISAGGVRPLTSLLCSDRLKQAVVVKAYHF